MKWYKVIEVADTSELEKLLNEMFGSEWRLHSWQAGSKDRLLVIFERRHVVNWLWFIDDLVHWADDLRHFMAFTWSVWT